VVVTGVSIAKGAPVSPHRSLSADDLRHHLQGDLNCMPVDAGFRVVVIKTIWEVHSIIFVYPSVVAALMLLNTASIFANLEDKE
jgi:hypothetical protein